MSRPIGADGRANCRTAQFREMFDALPQRIQALARAAFEQFLANPNHPSLRHHELRDNARGKHRTASRSVTVTMQYRAIYVVDEPACMNVWYWIGTHADYNHFTGRN